MDALVLDLAVQVLSALSMALLVWGGSLCIGGTSQARTTGAPERAEALFA
jgi:hypothetical protein